MIHDIYSISNIESDLVIPSGEGRDIPPFTEGFVAIIIPWGKVVIIFSGITNDKFSFFIN